MQFIWKFLCTLFGMADVTPAQARDTTVKAESYIVAFAISPDRKRLAVGTGNYSAQVFDVPSLRLRRTIRTHAFVECAALSPDGSRLVVGHLGAVTVWSVDRGTRERLFEMGDLRVSTVAFSHDGVRIACGCDGGAVFVFNTHTNLRENNDHIHHQSVFRVIFTPNGRLLITATRGGHIRAMNMADYTLRWAENLHHKGIDDITLTPDGTSLIIPSDDDALGLSFDVESGKAKVYISSVSGFRVFSPTPGVMATVSPMSGTVRIFDSAVGATDLLLHSHSIVGVAFDATGDVLLTAAANDQISARGRGVWSKYVVDRGI